MAKPKPHISLPTPTSDVGKSEKSIVESQTSSSGLDDASLEVESSLSDGDDSMGSEKSQNSSRDTVEIESIPGSSLDMPPSIDGKSP